MIRCHGPNELPKLTNRAFVVAFKSGTEILAVQWLGVTVWSTSARIVCRDAEGNERSYFLKV